MEEEKLGVYPHRLYDHWAPAFEAKYQMVDFLMNGDTAFSKNKIRKQEGRHCIFCNKNFPQTTFKNAAHLISKMIGNTSLYSTFECDACNNKFSKLETELGYFLGIGRSITGMKDNRLPPGFSGIGLNAKSFLLNGKKILVIKKEDAERNLNEGITKLKYKKPAYTPSNIYKLFLKCALSILPQEEVVSDFELALEYLKGGKVLLGACINIFRFPLTMNMPLHIHLFKKKNPNDKLPAYIVIFYFDNLVVSLPVLLHRHDLVNLKEPVEIPNCPPYFFYGNNINELKASFSTHNLSSPKKLELEEEEEITMKFDQSSLENSVRFDTMTGEVEHTKYNPAGSKYFIATEPGATFTKEEIQELTVMINNKFHK